MDIQQVLFESRDLAYREFQAKLIPNIAKESILGVRTPILREMAKKLKKEAQERDFLERLPHAYFDENQLHAFTISLEKDFERCVASVEVFLTYVDNWATCDQLSPKVFKKHRRELLSYIKKWLASEHTYTIRFGVGMLMEHFLDEDFEPEGLELVAELRSEEYYVNMMRAWYFATALAKQYEAALLYLQKGRMDQWTHRKTIQKAIESNRITAEQKDYLRSLKDRVS